jgi:NAD+ kinase
LNSNCDVFIIQKKTALERYPQRSTHIDFLEYAKKDEASYKSLLHAHQSHRKCRDSLVDHLQKLGLTFQILNLDELHDLSYPFWSPAAPSGVSSSLKLVISLGGDGTLLHASHFTGGSQRILGINSCPEHSVGFLCALEMKNMKEWLPKAIESSWQCQHIRRIQTVSSSGHLFPLALNDVFFCHQHPAATSRYEISIGDQNKESQLSSGCWVSTAAGSSAAIKGYGLPQLPIVDDKFLYAVREAYNPLHQPCSQAYLFTKGVISENLKISIYSKMRQALVCIDGPDNSGLLSFGEKIELSSSESCSLQLFVKPSLSI